MTPNSEPPVNRLTRRKQRTRAALIRAAQNFIAAGQLAVPVLHITQAADVGTGSFYNHFPNKEALFDAAVADVLDAHGALLDQVTASIADPATAFATSFRVTGRLFRQRPRESQIMLANGPLLLSSNLGLGPRAVRDITAANAAGRFDVDDPQVGLFVAGGALLGLGILLRDAPDRDDATTTDQVAEAVLRLFGMNTAEARTLCHQPLPSITTLQLSGSAARQSAANPTGATRLRLVPGPARNV